MQKSTMAGFAGSALIAPMVLLLVAILSTPAAATKAGEAAALCAKNPNCKGARGAWGGFYGAVYDPETGDTTGVICPAGKDCYLDKGGAARKRGTKVLGILKPPMAGMKPPGAGPAGPKSTRVPAAGVKFPTGSNRPPSFHPSGSGKRR
jgi:hypothetical protein